MDPLVLFRALSKVHIEPERLVRSPSEMIRGKSLQKSARLRTLQNRQSIIPARRHIESSRASDMCLPIGKEARMLGGVQNDRAVTFIADLRLHVLRTHRLFRTSYHASRWTPGRTGQALAGVPAALRLAGRRMCSV